MSMPSGTSPIMVNFIEKLKREIPCCGHYRDRKAYSLKNCDTMDEGKMRHFATVHHVPFKDDFRIVSKALYADNWCLKNSNIVYKKDKFEKEQDGLEFRVKYDGSGSVSISPSSDYQIALEILRRTKNKLPPCSPL